LIELVTVDTDTDDQTLIDNQRIDSLHSAFYAHTPLRLSSYGNMTPPSFIAKKSKLCPSFLFRLRILWYKCFLQNIRNTKVIIIRFISSLGLAKLLSQVYPIQNVPLVKGIADRTVCVSFGAINMAMLSLAKTLYIFGKEQLVIRKELGTQYSSSDYLLARVFAEFPLDILINGSYVLAHKLYSPIRTPLHILFGTFSVITITTSALGFAIGSWTNSMEEAMSIGFPIMSIFIIVGVLNPSGMSSHSPSWFINILKQISPVKFAIEALCVAEYKGMKFENNWKCCYFPKLCEITMIPNGEYVLEALGIGQKGYYSIMQDLGLLSSFYLVISWIGLLVNYCHFNNTMTMNCHKGDRLISVPVLRNI